MKSKVKTQQSDFVFFDGLRSYRETMLRRLSMGEYATYLVVDFDDERPCRRLLAIGTEEECVKFADSIPDEAVHCISMDGSPEPTEISFVVEETHGRADRIRRNRKGLHETEDRHLLPNDVGWESRPMPYSSTQAEMLFLYGGDDPVSKNKFIDCGNPVEALGKMAEMMREYTVSGVLLSDRVQNMLVCTLPGTSKTSISMLSEEDQELLSDSVVESYPTEKALFFRAGVVNTMGNNVLVVH